MIGLDTNVLARYYIADKADAEAAEPRAQEKTWTKSRSEPRLWKRKNGPSGRKE